jgi:hypothetical protein
MNFGFTVSAAIALSLLTACYEPPYRYDIRGNGQGGIDMQKVPKDPAPAPAPAPPPQAPSPAPSRDQQRIDELQQRVEQLSAENQKLKQQQQMSPATAPAKE